MKSRNKFLLTVSFSVMLFCSSTGVMLSMPIIPSTSSALVKNEQKRKKETLMKDIEIVVEKALRRKKRSRKKKRKKGQLSSIPGMRAAKKNPLSNEIRYLLEQQYTHQDLVKKIDIRLQDIDVVQAVGLIVKAAGFPIVVDANVHGQVNGFTFEGIPLGSALRILLHNNAPKLALVKDLKTWRIMLRKEAIELLLPKADALRKSNEKIGVVTIQHAKWDEKLKKRVLSLWHSIVGGQSKQYYMAFDDISRKLFFKGDKQHVAQLKQFIKEIDIKIPQVCVEARVVLADKDFEESFGMQWSGMFNRSDTITQRGYGFAGLGVGGGAGAQNDAYKNLFGWTLNFLPHAAKTVSEAVGLHLPFSWGNKGFSTRRLNLLLNLAEQKNEIKTVMKPTLLVNSGETAEILAGQELPQEVRLGETVEGNLTNITTVQYKDIGLKIKVKPQVKAKNKNIFLDIFVESSSLIKSPLTEFSPSGSAGNSKNFNYSIRTSRSKNRVLLKNGQTTLISGLLIDHAEVKKNGIPGLQEIPVLGWLFKGKRSIKKDEQLLIFITPTLM